MFLSSPRGDQSPDRLPRSAAQHSSDHGRTTRAFRTTIRSIHHGQDFRRQYFYTPDVALQDATRPAHLAHLRGLVDAGKLVASGPWGPGDARGGLLIFRVDDRAAIQAIVDRDPFITQGVVASSEIREWVPLLGPAAQALAADAAN